MSNESMPSSLASPPGEEAVSIGSADDTEGTGGILQLETSGGTPLPF